MHIIHIRQNLLNASHMVHTKIIEPSKKKKTNTHIGRQFIFFLSAFNLIPFHHFVIQPSRKFLMRQYIISSHFHIPLQTNTHHKQHWYSQLTFKNEIVIYSKWKCTSFILFFCLILEMINKCFLCIIIKCINEFGQTILFNIWPDDGCNDANIK